MYSVLLGLGFRSGSEVSVFTLVHSEFTENSLVRTSFTNESVLLYSDVSILPTMGAEWSTSGWLS